MIPVNSVQTLVLNQCLSATNPCKLAHKGCLPRPNNGYVCSGCLSGYVQVNQTNGYICVPTCEINNPCTSNHLECNWSSSNNSVVCGPDCESGYIKENEICKSPCDSELNECDVLNNELCNDTLKLGTALCINDCLDNDELHGITVCTESNFNGECTNVRTPEIFQQDVGSFYLKNGWEAYLCDNLGNCEYFGNAYEPIIQNFTGNNVEYIVTQPMNEEYFRSYMGNYGLENEPYAKIYNQYNQGVLYSGRWNNEPELLVYPEEVTSVSIDTNHIFLVEDQFGTSFFWDPREYHTGIVPGYDFGPNNSNTRYFINWSDFGMSGLTRFHLLDKLELDLSEIKQGAVFCNYTDELCYHRTNHTIFSANDPYNSTLPTQPNYLGSNILSSGNNINLLYIAPGWEAYLCNGINDTLQSCNHISQTGKVFSFYENFKKIYIQPVTQDAKYEYLQDKEFIEVFDKPGYRGNSIIFSGTKRYYNPINPVASLKKSSPFIRSYLKTSYSEPDLEKKYMEESETIPYAIETTRWKYIETEQAQNGLFHTDPYSSEDGMIIKFRFHCPLDNDCGGQPAIGNIQCLDDSGCTEVGTYCDLTKTTPICVYYPSKRRLYSETENFYLYPHAVATGKTDNIDGFSYSDYNLNTTNNYIKNKITVFANNNWEMYICSNNTSVACVKFPESGIINNILTNITEPLFDNLIKTIFVQPKEHNKMTQYLGFSEYKEEGIGNKGYVELFDEENFEGNRFILTNKQYDLKYTPMRNGKIKSIHVVGSIRPKVKQYNSNQEFYLPRHDVDENNENYEYIISDEYSPSVLISNAHDTPALYLAKGMLKNVPEFASTRYLFNTEITQDRIREESNTIFYGDQDKYYDGSDLVFVVAHGNWIGNYGSNQALAGIGDGVSSFMYQKHLGGSIGDAQTEWYLTAACQSLGRVDCLDDELSINDLCDCLEQYGGSCQWTNTVLKVNYDYDALPKTSSAEAINGYKEVFKNGLHGVGGYFRNSNWWTEYFWSDVSYSGFGKRFWNYVQKGGTYLTIGEAWRKVFYKENGGYFGIGARYAGYIAPGKCSDYVHGDYFWGTGETLPDPDMDYIIENGFCYFSKSSAKDKHFTFDQVIPTDEKNNWVVFNVSSTPSGITSAMAQYFENNEEGILIEDVSGDGTSFSYAEPNRKGRLPINIQTNDFHPEIDDKTYDYEVYKYYDNAYAFIQDKIAPYMSQDLILGDVKVSYGLEQHFDYDGNRLEAEIDEFQYTFSYHSGTGYFPERNYITISYNAATDRMVGIDVVLDNLIKTEETVKGTTILYDLEIARTNNPDNNFFAAYNLVNGSYRPAIFKISINKAELYKQY